MHASDSVVTITNREGGDPSGTSMYQDPNPVPSSWMCASKMAGIDTTRLETLFEAIPRFSTPCVI